MADQKDEVPEITPQVVHLIDLLKRAKEGRLRVPHFQREFVWRRQDIADLFDSIARQYPIGTLFLWGAQPVPSSRSNIGPLQLPEYKGETWLVLDGQQRLTTLVGVLLADEQQWSIQDDDDPPRWKLFFDADHQIFCHAKLDERPPLCYVPVPALLDTLKLFKHIETMLTSTDAESQSEQVPLNRLNIFQWISRAQEAARAIQSYRIPLVEIKTNNLGIAVESFSRLNKKGRDIGQDEMFSALTYREGETAFHLAVEIDKLQLEMIRSGFGEVDRTILLRAVLAAAKLDIYRTDWTLLNDQVKEEVLNRLPNAVQEASRGLERARRFLNELGVINARMLPYSMQLVALSAFYGQCDNPSKIQTKLLARWFWSSSFSGWFSGNSAGVRRLVDELRDEISQNLKPTGLKYMRLDQPALPTPLRFDLRSARVRTLLCVLFKQNPRQPDGTELGLENTARLLFERGPESMSTLCATVSDSDLRKSPANRILDVAPAIKGQAKKWILDLSDAAIRDEVLASHAIEPDSFALLLDGKHDEFLQRRMDNLCRIEREFMKKVQVTPPNSTEPALSPIDTEE